MDTGELTGSATWAVLKPGSSAAEGHRVLRDIIGLQVAAQGRDARVVTVSGEIDTLTAPTLASVLTEAAVRRSGRRGRPRQCRVPGIRRVIRPVRGQRAGDREDRELRVVCHSRMVNRLEATDLGDQLTFIDTVPEATST